MKYLMLLIFSLLITTLGYGQETDKKTAEAENTKALLDNKRFQFAAQSASPMRGRTISLSPGYGFKVASDTIECDLPYYGRSYSASMDPSDAGIKFTSTEFTYTVKDRKKSGWDVAIKAKTGTSGSHQIYLTVSTSGMASIRVVSPDRQTISFDGHVRP